MVAGGGVLDGWNLFLRTHLGLGVGVVLGLVGPEVCVCSF